MLVFLGMFHLYQLLYQLFILFNFVYLYTLFLKILSWANSFIPNNNIRSIILEIKTKDVKSLKYWYFILFPDNIFKVNNILKSKI